MWYNNNASVSYYSSPSSWSIFWFLVKTFMAIRTVLLLSIITFNNSQPSKEKFTSGVCLRAHTRKAEGVNQIVELELKVVEA